MRTRCRAVLARRAVSPGAVPSRSRPDSPKSDASQQSGDTSKQPAGLSLGSFYAFNAAAAWLVFDPQAQAHVSALLCCRPRPLAGTRTCRAVDCTRPFHNNKTRRSYRSAMQPAWTCAEGLGAQS